MKVLDLACARGHVFEGWFASEDDYLLQRERGLLQCPVCGEVKVEKQLSAPRLNLGKGRTSETSVPAGDGIPPVDQSTLVQAMRQVVANTEDVGERFAQEARRIHHGEAEQRGIRGRASWDEAAELLEEGIGVLPLPDLPLLKETLQ